MRTLLLAAVCGAMAATAASAQTFTFTTLDNPGDPTFNQLLGINDNGVIVGYFGSGQPGHPNIGYQIAPPYTKYNPEMQPGSLQTQATGINNAGLTTGFWSDTNTGSDNNFAFARVPNNGHFTYVSTIDPNTNAAPAISNALGVNKGNIVVGFYNDVSGTPHGFTYNIGTSVYSAVTLPNNPPLTATGINDSNEICGFFKNPSGATVGFVKNSTGGVVTKFTVPGTTVTQLFGINNEGVVVGSYTDTNNNTHGLYYTPANGNWLTVDQPNAVGLTVLNGLNNRGELVGFYQDAAGNFHGMIVTVSK
jgi:hypothetical protein